METQNSRQDSRHKDASKETASRSSSQSPRAGGQQDQLAGGADKQSTDDHIAGRSELMRSVSANRAKITQLNSLISPAPRSRMQDNEQRVRDLRRQHKLVLNFHQMPTSQSQSTSQAVDVDVERISLGAFDHCAPPMADLIVQSQRAPAYVRPYATASAHVAARNALDVQQGSLASLYPADLVCPASGHTQASTTLALASQSPFPSCTSEWELYRVLERANLVRYFATFLIFGGDDVQQLCDADEEEFLEIMNLVGMTRKPLHVRRLQKALIEWREFKHRASGQADEHQHQQQHQQPSMQMAPKLRIDESKFVI